MLFDNPKKSKHEKFIASPAISAQEWIKWESQLLSILPLVSLFSMLGTRYESNSHSTFGLPNLYHESDGPYYIYTLEDLGQGP